VELEGRNVVHTVPVDLYTAVLGGKIDVQTPEGRIKISIPAGSEPGKRLKLKGRGLPDPEGAGSGGEGRGVAGRGGAGRGDYVVKLEVQMPGKLTERERELFEELAALRTEREK